MIEKMTIASLTETVMLSMLLFAKDIDGLPHSKKRTQSRFERLCQAVEDQIGLAERITPLIIIEHDWDDDQHAKIRCTEIERLTLRYVSDPLYIHEWGSQMDIDLAFELPASIALPLQERLENGKPVMLSEIADITFPGGFRPQDHEIRTLNVGDDTTIVKLAPVYNPWEEARARIEKAIDEHFA